MIIGLPLVVAGPERDRHVLIVLDTGRTSAGRVDLLAIDRDVRPRPRWRTTIWR